MFHHLLILPLIAGLRPFEVLSRKSLLSLLLLDRLKDFLEIKYVNSYWYEDVHEGDGFQFQPFFAQLCPFLILLPNFKGFPHVLLQFLQNLINGLGYRKERIHIFQFFLEGYKRLVVPL